MAKKLSEGKKPCIWMEAGVIDYKICNKNFDCANCEFDRAMTETAIHNLALRKAGQKPTAPKTKIVFWQDKMRQGRPGPSGRAKPHLHGDTVCAVSSFDQLLEDQAEFFSDPVPPLVQEVFGFAVPTTSYLHRGHAWAVPESAGRVRLGLDDFSQKVLGPAEEIRLPRAGQKLHRDTVGLSLARQGKQADVLAPLNGVIDAVNPKVRQRPALAHDDPYGEGWLFLVTPTNLKPDLEHLIFGPQNVAWIENEAHRLLGMLETSAGVTLPSGGAIIDDVYGHFPQLGWERLVRAFLQTA